MDIIVTVAVPSGDGQDCKLISCVAEFDANSPLSALSEAALACKRNGLEDHVQGIRLKTTPFPTLLPEETFVFGGLKGLASLVESRKQAEAELTAARP